MRLIDADALIDELKTSVIWHVNINGLSVMGDALFDVIKSAPTVDAVSVVHSKWRWCGTDRWNDAFECLACGKIAIDDSNFCPKCGAKMDLEA